MVFIHHSREDQIKARLREIERAEDIRILYACEAGIRVWGFPSPESGNAVRFSYAHPVEWYLSLERRREVIELPREGGLDLKGWDVRQALTLFRRSNPPLLEWLQSTIVYWRVPGFAERLQQLLPEYYDPRSCLHYYRHLAWSNFREFPKGESVPREKYFGLLRPLLACLWIERGYGPVPTEFLSIVDRAAPTGPLRDAIDELVMDEPARREMNSGERVPILEDFIETQMPRLEAILPAVPPSQRRAADPLDGIFRDVIGLSKQQPRPGFTGVRRYDAEPPIDDSGLHDDTCEVCRLVRKCASPAALDTIMSDFAVPLVIRVFDVFSRPEFSRSCTGGSVLHVLRQLARKAHRVYVVKMDCYKRPRSYHEHAIWRFPTVRIYAYGRQVECARLHDIFPASWSVLVQSRPQESDLRRLHITDVFPADFEWTMVEKERITSLKRAVEAVRAVEDRRFRQWRENEDKSLRRQREEDASDDSTGKDDIAEGPVGAGRSETVTEEWFKAARKFLPTEALVGETESRLQEAAQAQEEIAIRYFGGSTPGRTRRIVPKKVFLVEGFPWRYVLAQDVAKNEERVFRIDRVTLDQADWGQTKGEP